MIKRCHSCELFKDETEFHKNATKADGLQPYCKMCAYINQRRYLRSPLGKLNTQHHARKRREQKKLIESGFSFQDAMTVKAQFDHKCFNCDSTKDLAIDHHYPLQLGFSLAITNAVLLCRSCNSAKHCKMPEEFYSTEQLEILNTVFGVSRNPEKVTLP